MVMQKRTLSDVANELRSEGHLPMVRLVESIENEQWANQLDFDASMLRLWAARKGVPEVEIMVTYGDGRHGGRPLNMDLDAFDLAFRTGGGWTTLPGINSSSVLENIRSWLEPHD
jgi:hypothetical protein